MKMRDAVLSGGDTFRFKAVADPRFGKDVGHGCFVLNFFSQLADKDSQVLRLFSTVTTPDGGKKFSVCEYFVRIMSKVNEQIEFFGS